MNYLKNKALYYSFIISDLSGCEAPKAYRKIAPLFFCRISGEDTMALENRTLKQLCSSKMISLYNNYLAGISKSETEFGKSDSEKRLIRIKKEALTLSEGISDNDATTVVDLQRNAKEYPVVYAILLYFYGKSESIYLPILRETHEDPDAITVLLALEKDKEQRWRIYEEMKRNNIVLSEKEMSEIKTIKKWI